MVSQRLRILQDNRFVTILAWIAFGVALVAALGAHDLRIVNSDVLRMPALYHELVDGTGSLSDWRLSHTYFFPDVLSYFLLAPLTGNAVLTLAMLGVLQTVAYTLGWVLVARQLPGDGAQRTVAQAAIVLVAALFIALDRYDPAPTSVAFHSFSLSFHFGVVLVTPYFVALTLSVLQKSSAGLRDRPVVALFALSLLMALSDVLVVIEVTLPLLLVMLGLFWLARIELKQALNASAPLLAGAAAGMIVSRWAIAYPYSDRFLSNMDARQIGQSVTAFLVWLADWKANNPLVALIVVVALACHLFAVVFAVRAAVLRRGYPLAPTFVSAFVVCTAALSALGSVATGNFENDAMYRYVLPLYLLPVPALMLWIPARAVHLRGARLAPVLVAGALIVAHVPAVSSLPSLAKYASLYPPLSECLDRETQARGLQNGIATYWDAKYLTALSRHELNIIQVSADVLPYHWISNIKWYERYLPDFVVSDPGIHEGYRIAEGLLKDKFGEPAERFECPGRTVYVYNRPGDAFFHTYLRDYPFADFSKPGAEAAYDAIYLPGKVGRLAGRSRVAADGEAGVVTYGPEVVLPAGAYAARIEYEAAGAAGGWQLSSRLPYRLDKLKEGLLPPGQTSVQFEFNREQTSNPIDIQISHSGTGTFTVRRVVLRRLN